MMKNKYDEWVPLFITEVKEEPTIRISDGRISINSLAMKELHQPMHVKFEFVKGNPILRLIAETMPDDDRGQQRSGADNGQVVKIGDEQTSVCSNPWETDVIFEAMGWDKQYRNRLFGSPKEIDAKRCLAFDLQYAVRFQKAA